MDLNTLYHRTVESWADRVNAVAGRPVGRPHARAATGPCATWPTTSSARTCGPRPSCTAARSPRWGTASTATCSASDPINSALSAAAWRRRGPSPSRHRRRRHRAPVVRRGAAGRVRPPARRRPPDPRLGPRGRDRRRPPARPGAWSHEVATWFAEREELYRAAGAVGPRAASHGDAQGDLLAALGRDAEWGPNHACLARFSAAFGRGDVDAIMALMTDDCVFEATGPAPDGVRHEGADAVRAVWEELFGNTRDAAFTEEESFVVRRPRRAPLALRLDRRRRRAGHVRGCRRAAAAGREGRPRSSPTSRAEGAANAPCG